LAKALIQEGWSVFWDFTIPAGMTWRRFLLEKLEDTRSLIVVWSKYSIESEWVMEETDEAKRQKKPIIPILFDNVSPPFGYRAIHCRNLSDWDGSLTSPIFLHLIQDIKNSLGQQFINSTGMQFVLIPAGTFMMGSPLDEEGRYDREKQHQVTISRPLYLQTTPVTQGQWERVMGDNPSRFKECGKDCPVEQVSWDDIQEFMKKLNQMEKTDKYRLPTEAEWEYACRAGSKGRWCFGDDGAKLGEYAWYAANSGKKTHPVGQKKPNSWGLYDIHGNVFEWVQDWYGEYPAGPVTDPKGPPSGKKRVLRGGSWIYFAKDTRSALRDLDNPDFRMELIGFRIARDL
jgi:formylglycine-generating enzyme required for sulfatase activity